MKLLLCYFDPNAGKILVEKTNEKGEKIAALSSVHNFFVKNEVIARIIDVDSPENARSYLDEGYTYFNVVELPRIKAGEGVFHDPQDYTYKASEYGFAVLDRESMKLKMIGPYQIARDKMHAYCLIVPSQLRRIPGYLDIEQELAKRKIITILNKDDILNTLKSIDASVQKINRVLVARGKEPVHGYEEYFTPLMSLEKKAGKVLEDGRIDFKEVESIIEIKKGQEVLKRFPGFKPEDGFDIYGEKAAGTMLQKDGYRKGENLVESGSDPNTFVASIDGCLVVEGKSVYVSPLAIVRGDVDYDTGNIDFSGSVHVYGSVLPGFSVKAKDDIIIDKNADDAYLGAGRDIFVKQGITGKGKMKATAGGKLKARYLLNADVEAIQAIEIESSIINSTVFSNEKVTVTAKEGKIIGGEITARHEIKVKVAGVPKENVTKLSVGKSLIVEKEISIIRTDIETLKQQINEVMINIRNNFGEGLFTDPKKFLAVLNPVKKKKCLELLSELTQKNKELGQLNEKKAESEKKLKLDREPVIVVSDTIYPGTIISIKNSHRNIEDKLTNVKFYEDPEHKEVRYTSAV